MVELKSLSQLLHTFVILGLNWLVQEYAHVRLMDSIQERHQYAEVNNNSRHLYCCFIVLLLSVSN